MDAAARLKHLHPWTFNDDDVMGMEPGFISSLYVPQVNTTVEPWWCRLVWLLWRGHSASPPRALLQSLTKGGRVGVNPSTCEIEGRILSSLQGEEKSITKLKWCSGDGYLYVFADLRKKACAVKRPCLTDESLGCKSQEKINRRDVWEAFADGAVNATSTYEYKHTDRQTSWPHGNASKQTYLCRKIG